VNINKVMPIILLLMLNGCAGSTANPIFNSSVKKAYIYSPVEVKALGLGAKFAKATGEVRYCAAGMPALVQSRKSEALAGIAEACGGEDKYAIIDELQTDGATGKFMGVDVQCTGFAGRIVYFTCKGAKPKPTGYDK
jgi:hypothetical protein